MENAQTEVFRHFFYIKTTCNYITENAQIFRRVAIQNNYFILKTAINASFS